VLERDLARRQQAHDVDEKPAWDDDGAGVSRFSGDGDAKGDLLRPSRL
jgi:hypothetical protein